MEQTGDLDQHKRKKLRKKGRTPKWAAEPFRECYDLAIRLGHLVRLSMKGISIIESMPTLVELLAEGDTGASEEDKRKAIQRAKIEAQLANTEVSEGFPLLHGQVIISLWSALEAAVIIFVARWLENTKEAYLADEISKLRIRLGEYEPLTKSEKCYYILERLEQEFALSMRQGANRYESLLAIVGLSGTVPENVKAQLFEMHQVRNLLVHKNSIADKRFAAACPWFNVKAGDRFPVTGNLSWKYYNSVLLYLTLLMVRVGKHFGSDMSCVEERCQEYIGSLGKEDKI